MEEAILHSDMNTIKLLINRDNAKSAFLYACEKGKLNVVDYLYSKSKLYGLSPSLLYKAVHGKKRKSKCKKIKSKCKK